MTENQKLREALRYVRQILTKPIRIDSHTISCVVAKCDEALAMPPAVPESLEALSRKLDTQTPDLEVSEIAAGFSDLSCGSAKAYDFDSFLEGANFAEQKLRNAAALALPTADHLPNAGKMINGLTQSETYASASVSGLTAAPVGERGTFESAFDLVFEAYATPADRFHDHEAWALWQHGKITKAFSLMQQARAALSAGDAVDGPLIDEGSKPALSPLSDKDAIALIEEHTNDDNVIHAHEAIDLIRSVERAHGIDAAMRKGQL